MIATDAQVRKLVEELKKHGKLGLAATRAGLDRKTAAKYGPTVAGPHGLATASCWLTGRPPSPPACEALERECVTAVVC